MAKAHGDSARIVGDGVELRATVAAGGAQGAPAGLLNRGGLAMGRGPRHQVDARSTPAAETNELDSRTLAEEEREAD